MGINQIKRKLRQFIFLKSINYLLTKHYYYEKNNEII